MATILVGVDAFGGVTGEGGPRRADTAGTIKARPAAARAGRRKRRGLFCWLMASPESMTAGEEERFPGLP
jgi:hypothetical protein